MLEVRRAIAVYQELSVCLDELRELVSRCATDARVVALPPTTLGVRSIGSAKEIRGRLGVVKGLDALVMTSRPNGQRATTVRRVPGLIYVDTDARRLNALICETNRLKHLLKGAVSAVPLNSKKLFRGSPLENANFMQCCRKLFMLPRNARVVRFFWVCVPAVRRVTAANVVPYLTAHGFTRELLALSRLPPETGLLKVMPGAPLPVANVFVGDRCLRLAASAPFLATIPSSTEVRPLKTLRGERMDAKKAMPSRRLVFSRGNVAYFLE